MYRLSEYDNMIRDDVRTGAYVRALQAVVRPGDVVIEIGTGVGFFAVLACRLGAARVYAIEPNPVIHLGPELARANGCADRIEFLPSISTAVSVPPGDVLVSDLRGVLSLLDDHIPVIADARRRFLKPGGVQIPVADTLRVALARSGRNTTPPEGSVVHGIELEPLAHAMVNFWRPERMGAEDLMSAPATWVTIDWRTVVDPDIDGCVSLVADRSGSAAGVSMWFDTELHAGIGFSTSPLGRTTVYAQGFFPFPTAVPLGAGDSIELRIRAKLVGAEYVWSWSGKVVGGPFDGATFEQSTFHSFSLSPSALRRRADRFVPTLGRVGQAHGWMMGRMGGSASLGEVAREAAQRYPDVFADEAQALRTAADLSERFSE